MNHLLRLVLLGVVLAAGLAARAGPEPAGASPTEFARIVRDGNGAPLALQMAIVTYVPADGSGDFSVDLISAIHVGDPGYYDELNARFRAYDALLFEMVVPDDKSPPRDPGSGGTSFIGVMQRGIKDMLGLSYQLEEIDYAAPNFVHADLSAGMLLESMEERGESLYVYFWRLVFASLDQYARDPLGMQDWRVLSGLLTSGEDDALKVAVAGELLASMKTGDIFGGENGSALIAARNEHAVGVLTRQIDGGGSRIGIFYGVAHMADFERRLSDELELVKKETEWVDAWRFGANPGAPAE